MSWPLFSWFVVGAVTGGRGGGQRAGGVGQRADGAGQRVDGGGQCAGAAHLLLGGNTQRQFFADDINHDFMV